MADVLESACHEEHGARVRDWALSVWAAWREHHETLRRWVEERLG